MTKNYKEKLKIGKEYEAFVCKLLKERINLEITVFENKEDQYNIGESKQGFEIKFDNKHKETGNLFIEVEEKSNQNNPNYVKSGILRNDNSWALLIGNREKIYFFGINTLKLLYESKKFRTIEIKEKTAKGFLLNEKHIEKYSEKTIIV